MNREKLAEIYKEIKNFNAEIITKMDDAINRRKLLKVEGSWSEFDNELDFLINYFDNLRLRSGKMLRIFLDNMMRIEFEIRLSELNTKDLPKAPKVEKTASEPAELVCGKCGRADFKNAKGLSNHVRICKGKTVEGLNPTTCPDCKHDFKTATKLKIHLLTGCACKDVDVYQCEVCKKWKPETTRVEHQLYHKYSNEKKEKPVIQEEVKEIEAPSIEVKDEEKKVKGIICVDCQNTFQFPGQLRDHRKDGCPLKGVETYLCPYCNKMKPLSAQYLHYAHHYRKDPSLKPKKEETESEDLKKKEPYPGKPIQPKILIASKDSPIGCSKCYRIMYSKEEQEEHKKTCGKEKDGDFDPDPRFPNLSKNELDTLKCDNCGAKKLDLNELNAHIERVHSRY